MDLGTHLTEGDEDDLVLSPSAEGRNTAKLKLNLKGEGEKREIRSEHISREKMRMILVSLSLSLLQQRVGTLMDVGGFFAANSVGCATSAGVQLGRQLEGGK